MTLNPSFPFSLKKPVPSTEHFIFTNAKAPVSTSYSIKSYISFCIWARFRVRKANVSDKTKRASSASMDASSR